MLRFLRLLIGGIAALVLVLWAGFLLLRDIPPGAYRPDLPAEQGGDDLVEVSRFLPIITFHQVEDAHVLRALTVPVLHKVLPLGLEGQSASYLVPDGVRVILTTAGRGPDQAVTLQPISDDARGDWLKQAEVARQEMKAQYQRIAGAALTPTWSAPILGGRLGLHLSDDLTLAVDESAPDQFAAIRFKGRPFDQKYRLSIRPAGSVQDEIATFRDRFPTAAEIGPDRWIVRTGKGGFHLIAGISDGPDPVALAQGQAEDEAEAARFLAVLNGLTVGAAPYALTAGDYIGPPSPTPDALQNVIAAALSPIEILRNDGAGRVYTTDGLAEGMPWMPVKIRFGFLPEGTLFPPSEMQIAGEQADRGLRFEIDSAVPRCAPQRYHRLGAPQEQGQLLMAFQSYGSGLPQCRDLAGILAGLDLDAMPEIQLAAKLAPHFWKYTTVRTEDDRIIASGPGRSVILDLAGKTLLDSPAELLAPVGDGYVIRRDGREGVIDGQGRTILPAEYDEVGYPASAGSLSAVVEVVQDGQRGLYAVEQQRFLLPVAYDSIQTIGDTALILGRKGDLFEAHEVARGQMLPGLFDQFIIGAPARASVGGRDFIALRQDDGAWIFWTRQPQPLLEGRFQAVELETGPVTRNFLLTRAEGSRFGVTSDLEPLPAP